MDISTAITLLRTGFLDDNVEPYMWSDEILAYYLNNAEKEACRRSNVLIDSVTPTICNISILANTSTYAVSPLILFFLSGSNITDGYPMYQISKVSLDSYNTAWRADKADRPSYFFMDSLGWITIYPTPTKAFTMNVTVSRLPIIENKSGMDNFEIPIYYHHDLLYWAAYMALSLQDVNTNKRVEAEKFLVMFEQKFGKRKSAQTEITKIRNPRLQSIAPQSQYLGFP